jgi:hypothetical protein
VRILLVANDDSAGQAIRSVLAASTTPRFEVHLASNDWEGQVEAADGGYDALIVGHKLIEELAAARDEVRGRTRC